MNLVIDLIVIAIIAVCVMLSARKGFVKTFIEVAGFVAAIILTFTISSPLAQVTYDKIIEPPIIEAAVSSAAESTEEKALDAIPEIFVNGASGLGFSLEEFTNKISDNISKGTETAVRNASKEVVRPIVTKILGLIYSVVIMLVLMVVVKFLARIINKVFSFSVVGKANRVLGGIIGVPKGVVFAILFCLIVSLIVSLYGDFLIFTAQNIEKTYLFKLLAEIITF